MFLNKKGLWVILKEKKKKIVVRKNTKRNFDILKRYQNIRKFYFREQKCFILVSTL